MSESRPRFEIAHLARTELFTPDPDELAFAHRVVAAFDAAAAQGRSALTVDGTFVDYPVALRARRLIDPA